MTRINRLTFVRFSRTIVNVSEQFGNGQSIPIWDGTYSVSQYGASGAVGILLAYIYRGDDSKWHVLSGDGSKRRAWPVLGRFDKLSQAKAFCREFDFDTHLKLAR